MAITTLVVWIAAALAGWAPVLGVVIGVVAIVLGAITLVKRQSKPLAVTGVVLGALATVTSLVVTLTLGALGGNLLNELDDMDVSADGSFEEVEPGVIVDPDELEGEDVFELEGEDLFETDDGDGSFEAPLAEPAHAPTSTASGTEEDPHLMGTRIVDEEWDMVVNRFVPVINDRSDKKTFSAPEPNHFLKNLEISDHFTGNAIFEIPTTGTPGGLNISFGFGATTSMYIAIE